MQIIGSHSMPDFRKISIQGFEINTATRLENSFVLNRFATCTKPQEGQRKSMNDSWPAKTVVTPFARAQYVRPQNRK